MTSSTRLYPPLRYALLDASPLPDHPNSEALHRGAFPRPHNLPFLARLHLKTILSLTPKSPAAYEKEEKAERAEKEGGPTPRKRRSELEEEGGSLVEWAQKKGIKLVHFKAGKSKDGSVPFNTATIKQILELLICADNYPLYMHDLDGSDVLALVVAAMRKTQGRAEKDWVAEMSRFLRTPPPEPDHLTFIRRLFMPSTTSTSSTTASSHHSHSHHATSTPTSSPSDESQQLILIPPPSKRVSWLWPQGMPVASGSSAITSNGSTATGGSGMSSGGKKGGLNSGMMHHISMRVRVEHDVEVVGSLSNSLGPEVEKDVSTVSSSASSINQGQTTPGLLSTPTLHSSSATSSSNSSTNTSNNSATLRPPSSTTPRATPSSSPLLNPSNPTPPPPSTSSFSSNTIKDQPITGLGIISPPPPPLTPLQSDSRLTSIETKEESPGAYMMYARPGLEKKDSEGGETLRAFDIGFGGGVGLGVEGGGSRNSSLSPARRSGSKEEEGAGGSVRDERRIDEDKKEVAREEGGGGRDEDAVQPEIEREEEEDEEEEDEEDEEELVPISQMIDALDLGL